MRLTRGVVRPANFAVTRQFQGGQGIEILSSGLHSESTETSNPVHWTYMQCRGKSNAASAQSDIQETRKSGRRVPKGERKLLVESYVTKYRTMNAGKFPSVTDAQRDVGGSFYIVREILQELIHNSSVSSSKGTTSVEKVHVKQDEASTETGEIIRPKEVGKLEEQISKLDTKVSMPEILESKEKTESSSPVQDTLSDEIRLSSSVDFKSTDVELHPQLMTGESDSSLNTDHKSDKKDDTLAEHRAKTKEHKSTDVELHPQLMAGDSDSSLNTDHKSDKKHDTLAEHRTKTKEHKSTESGSEFKVPDENIEPQQNSSIWQNLKSFANGILGIWRRS